MASATRGHDIRLVDSKLLHERATGSVMVGGSGGGGGVARGAVVDLRNGTLRDGVQCQLGFRPIRVIAVSSARAGLARAGDTSGARGESRSALNPTRVAPVWPPREDSGPRSSGCMSSLRCVDGGPPTFRFLGPAALARSVPIRSRSLVEAKDRGRTSKSHEVELSRTTAVSRSSVLVIAWNCESISRWASSSESSESIFNEGDVGEKETRRRGRRAWLVIGPPPVHLPSGATLSLSLLPHPPFCATSSAGDSTSQDGAQHES